MPRGPVPLAVTFIPCGWRPQCRGPTARTGSRTDRPFDLLSAMSGRCFACCNRGGHHPFVCHGLGCRDRRRHLVSDAREVSRRRGRVCLVEWPTRPVVGASWAGAAHRRGFSLLRADGYPVRLLVLLGSGRSCSRCRRLMRASGMRFAALLSFHCARRDESPDVLGQAIGRRSLLPLSSHAVSCSSCSCCCRSGSNRSRSGGGKPAAAAAAASRQ